MLTDVIIKDVIDAALSTGGDFAEIYVEDNKTTELVVVGGQMESGIKGTDFGVGIRIFSGVKSFYAYSNDGKRETLVQLAKSLAKAVKSEKSTIPLYEGKILSPLVHKSIVQPSSVSMKEKLILLQRAHQAAKNYDSAISQTNIRYIDQEQTIQLANSEGLLARDRRVRTRVLFTAVAELGGKMQTGYVGPGALKGYEFYDTIDLNQYAIKAAKMAKTMVEADYSPAGKMPVIVENAFGGLLFHEACGHSLEAGSVAKGMSVFSNRIGEKIGSEVLTLIDDGTMPNAWGSMGTDDEGNLPRKNVLIENGILKGYLIDKFNGRRMGMEATGSSRRQSYRLAPTARMSNTYIAAGKSTREEIIGNTEYGLYAKTIGAGSVNPTTGEFNFSVIEGYMIKNGKIDRPVKGATLVGNGEDILKSVDMVGNNLELGQGYCMAESGTIFVSMGQPTIRIQSITVGGRADA